MITLNDDVKLGLERVNFSYESLYFYIRLLIILRRQTTWRAKKLVKKNEIIDVKLC